MDRRVHAGVKILFTQISGGVKMDSGHDNVDENTHKHILLTFVNMITNASNAHLGINNKKNC